MAINISLKEKIIKKKKKVNSPISESKADRFK